MPWTREQMKSIVERVLGYAPGVECEVAVEARANSHTRFARNEITTSGLAEDLTIVVTCRKEGRAGTISTNDLGPEALRAAVARADELRALLPPDPEAVDLLPAQTYPDLPKFHADAATARADERAVGVKAALGLAKKKALTTAGFYENGVVYRAIGNSKGNFGYHTATSAEFTATMRTQDGTGSGWASSTSTRLSDVDPQAVAARSADKGLASAKPRDVPPGDYTVILEPAAVASLLQAMQFAALSARTADEGRSVFSKEGGGSRLGEKVAHESVTLMTDPFDPRIPGLPWAMNSGGLPNRKVSWIEKGVLKTLSTDRYWAKTTGKEPTPTPGSLVMAGGTQSLDELIASTEKGLLVTRFWYIRTVNPQTAHQTGLTRDGLFLIEKGKIAYPVTNLRFNESPVVMLQNVEGMTAAVPAAGMILPTIKSREFTFTSKSDAV